MANLKDASIRHQVFTQRFASGIVRDVMRLLNKADAELASRIRPALERAVVRGSAQAVLSEVRSLGAVAYAAVERLLTERLREWAVFEAEFQQGMVSKFLPAGANFTQPSLALVQQAITSEPLRGKLLREWVAELSEARYVRVRDAVRIGIIEGQTVDQMARVIRGTRDAGYADGLLETDRRGAEALVRTAVNHVSTETRDAVFEENDDIVEAVQWVATLDDRTCPVCAPLDGEMFDLADGPRPPRHVGCRCTIIPVFKPEFDILPTRGAERPAKGDGGAERVPATQTYQTWLRGQSAEFQDETLGPTRGALFRRGDLTVDRFVNRAGDQLTLDELRQREPAAFREANL